MQITDKQKRIILIVLGIVVVLLILLLVLRGCSPKEYNITFDTDGGSNISSLTIKKEGKITKPEDPTKEGYIFEGWYYNDQEFDFNTEITKDMKLVAKWSKIEVTGINLNAQSLTLKPNGIAELEVIFTPEGTSSELIWESSDSKIVTVDENGELKALKDGTATITVTTKDGKYKATCKITVKKDAVAVTSVSINGSKEVMVGSTIKLTANIKPKDASNKEVTWKSNNKNIATVDSKGNVKGVKAGKVKITVTTVDGEKEATIEITVKEKSTNNPSTEKPSTQTPTTPSKPSTGGSTTPSTGGNSGGETKPSNIPVTKVVITGPKSVSMNKSITLKVSSYEPSNATSTSFTWESSNNSIATVKDGIVNGIEEGDVTILVKNADGKVVGTYDISVTANYIVKFTHRELLGNITDYLVIVTRNGEKFTSFEDFYFNNELISSDTDVVSPDNIISSTAKTVTFKNTKTGKNVTATVVIDKKSL